MGRGRKGRAGQEEQSIDERNVVRSSRGGGQDSRARQGEAEQGECRNNNDADEIEIEATET